MQMTESLILWAGCYSNAFIRQLGRDLERISRPARIYEESPCDEAVYRVRRLFQAVALVPFACIATPLSFGLHTLSHLFVGQRLECIDAGARLLTAKKVHILSLNVCFQEGPFAPLYGGVVPPFDRVNSHDSRVQAIAHFIATQKPMPDIVLGQEFSALHAQDVFVEEMKKRGYRYFIIDRAPHPVFNNSGLLVASKYRLSDVQFIPYPYSDRCGGGRINQNGALMCTVVDGKGQSLLRIINVHLNAEYGPEADNTRIRQLKNHVVPHFTTKLPTILAGDFNFDTSDKRVKRAAGLGKYKNVFEGQVTCTNEGFFHLRGETGPLVEEKIDALMANSPKIKFSNAAVKRVEDGDELLTDHYALTVTSTLSNNSRAL